MLDYLRIINVIINENQGTLSILIALTTAIFAWRSGIIKNLRKNSDLRIDIIDGPSFSCTFGTGSLHKEFDVHRTGIAAYLHISNIGSKDTSIDRILIGYHWAAKPFSLDWIRYRLGWCWLAQQAICLTDFQVAIGDNVKFYPFLIQKSSISGSSGENFLRIGQSTKGGYLF